MEVGAESETSRDPSRCSEGIIEVSGKGFGFLRDPKRNFVQSPTDIFVTPEVVANTRCATASGSGAKSAGADAARSFTGSPPSMARTRRNSDNIPLFEELTTINPNKRITLETVSDRHTTRIMDMMTPLGKGQRGLIVAPPRTGKTTLLEHIADAMVKNHPEMKLIILLVDERPEEVTEIRRTLPDGGDHGQLERQRHQEPHPHRAARHRARQAPRRGGPDVFVLLDSITRVGPRV